jgi:hypothetical protein
VAQKTGYVGTVRKRWQLLFAMVMLFFALGCLAYADDAPTEHQVKSAFLYNFAKFVEWPPGALGDERSSFNLCVLGGGESFIGTRDLLAGKTVKGRKLVVKQVETPANAQDCHILFVSAEETRGTSPELTGLKSAVLNVGEADDFIKRGGIINLVRVENKFRFEINRSAGERAGFRFSSQLLKLAIIVANDS